MMAMHEADKPRRWTFGSAEFDDSSWILRVDGEKVDLEMKPLRLLRVLLINPGKLVTKEQLLDEVWTGVFVSEASITTAVRKLRKALRDEARDNPIIETVARSGYRLVADVEVTPLEPISASVSNNTDESRYGSRKRRFGERVIAAGVLMLTLSVAAYASLRPTGPANTIGDRDLIEVKDALRRLDRVAIGNLLAEGWDPNEALNPHGDRAISVALEICEWEPHHDQQELQALVRMLLDADAQLAVENSFGDTPYEIASADRYCGADHPVTRMIEALCRSKSRAYPQSCLYGS